MTALTAEALVGGADDDRGIDARRADVLVGWAQAALANPDLPKRQGHRPTIYVTVDLATLLALADNPAELAGYGPIPARSGTPCWTAAGRPTRLRKHSSTSSSPATAAVAYPAAAYQRTSATSTTRSRLTRAAAPAPRISGRCAEDITG